MDRQSTHIILWGLCYANNGFAAEIERALHIYFHLMCMRIKLLWIISIFTIMVDSLRYFYGTHFPTGAQYALACVYDSLWKRKKKNTHTCRWEADRQSENRLIFPNCAKRDKSRHASHANLRSETCGFRAYFASLLIYFLSFGGFFVGREAR